ncbi:MAG: lasso RiPP family leader peptide-containing protein [Candidatus Binatus sp.]
MKENRSADAKKKQKLTKYVPPTLVDYGNVTKITATPKSISGPDAPGSKKKG